MMYEELNEQLRDAKARVSQKRKDEGRLQACREELQEAERQAQSLKAQLEDNEHDWKQLHGLSFAHLIASVSGKQDERERDVQKQVTLAKLQYDTAAETARELQKEVSSLADSVQAMGDVEAAYERLLAKKEDLMEQADTPIAKQLLELIQREVDMNAEIKETDEAVRAAELALESLTDCDGEIRKAKNWGTWDMFGGGVIATAIKREHMEDAQALITNAQHYLRRLQRELRDLHWQADIQVDTGGFLKFADYFFDGLFVDWAVQNQLSRAENQIVTCHAKVDTLFRRLQNRRHELERRLDGLKQERTQLIEAE